MQPKRLWKSNSDGGRCPVNSTRRPGKTLKKAGATISVELLQKTALLGTAQTLKQTHTHTEVVLESK